MGWFCTYSLEAMKKYTIYILTVFLSLNLWAQNKSEPNNALLFVRAEKGKNEVKLKWFTEQIYAKEGFVLYRSENGGAFQKITPKPLKKSEYKIPDERQNEETKLFENYFSKNNYETGVDPMMDLILIQELIFKEDYAFVLGIQWNDNQVNTASKYQYKLVEIINGEEKELAVSEQITVGENHFAPAPTNVRFKGSNKKILIGWDPQSELYYGVNIYKKRKGSNEPEVKINNEPILLSQEDEDGKSVVSKYLFEEKGLKEGDKFTYSLVSVDYFGLEAGRVDALEAGTVDLIPPSAPYQLKNEVDHVTKSVAIAWDAEMADDHAGFQLMLSNNDSSGFTPIGNSINKEHKSHTIEIEEIGIWYIKVQAIDTNGNASLSETMRVQILDKIPPSIPKGVQLSFDDKTLTLKWEPNTEPDLAGYIIYRAYADSKNMPMLKMMSRPFAENTYSETFPSNRVENYIYYVVSRDTNGNQSEVSEPVLLVMPNNTAPSRPFLREAKVENNTIVLQWNESMAKDLAGYHVYKQILPDSTWQRANKALLQKGVDRFTDRNIEVGKKQIYAVSAIDTAKNESEKSNSKEVFVSLSANSISFTQFNSKINARKGSVLLNWEMNTTENIVAYIVYGKTEGEEVFAPLSANLNQTSFEIKNLEDGNHHFYVVAYLKNGKKMESDKLTLTHKSKSK